ncbi:MAG TPA: hypothetical protein VF188_16285 [Longimicrobiales bacterium]|jgi:hypothetical protein
MAHIPDYRFALSNGDGGPCLILKDYSAPYDRQDVLILSYEDAAQRLLAHDELVAVLRHILEAIDTCGDDAVHYALANHQTLGDVVSEARAALAKARAASKE